MFYSMPNTWVCNNCGRINHILFSYCPCVINKDRTKNNRQMQIDTWVCNNCGQVHSASTSYCSCMSK